MRMETVVYKNEGLETLGAILDRVIGSGEVKCIELSVNGEILSTSIIEGNIADKNKDEFSKYKDVIVEEYAITGCNFQAFINEPKRKLSVLSLSVDTTGVFDNNFSIKEYEIDKETNAKIYYEVIKDVVTSKMKKKLNEVSVDLSTDRILLRVFCYSDDKEKYTKELFDRAEKELNLALNNISNMLKELNTIKGR